MGLDTYAAYAASHPKYEDVGGTYSLLPDSLFPPNALCGGMLSGGGNSFRGKVYNDYIEWATGETLYSEELSPDTVIRMANALEGALNRFLTYKGLTTKPEATDIAVWFRKVADEKASVIGWW